MKKNKTTGRNAKNPVDVPERMPWDDGFSAFKRRINEQLQLSNADFMADDDDLLGFYRMGESENYVLSALGCVFG